jgi:hypothetical protein
MYGSVTPEAATTAAPLLFEHWDTLWQPLAVSNPWGRGVSGGDGNG